MAKDNDGNTIEVGMDVVFKYDTELYGRVTKIKKNPYHSGHNVTIEVSDGNGGSDTYDMDSDRVWVE